jgi:hypothetical protein
MQSTKQFDHSSLDSVAVVMPCSRGGCMPKQRQKRTLLIEVPRKATHALATAAMHDMHSSTDGKHTYTATWRPWRRGKWWCSKILCAPAAAFAICSQLFAGFSLSFCYTLVVLL